MNIPVVTLLLIRRRSSRLRVVDRVITPPTVAAAAAGALKFIPSLRTRKFCALAHLLQNGLANTGAKFKVNTRALNFQSAN